MGERGAKKKEGEVNLSPIILVVYGTIGWRLVMRLSPQLVYAGSRIMIKDATKSAMLCMFPGQHKQEFCHHLLSQV